MNIDWSKAPEWANAVVAASAGTLYFVEAFGVRSKRQAVSNSYACGLAADMTIKSHLWKLIEERPKKQEAWGGEGLPPVGTVCDMHIDDFGWITGTVVAHIDLDEPTAVAHNGKEVFHGNASDFRPIKTVEQLAEEERNATIQDIRDIANGALDRGITGAEAIYLAGYRKQ